jgi:tetratricopeptide (TPR) repeat protein
VENPLAIDREDTLKKAEKLLRQGRLDGAIVEYVRVVEDQPHDWTTANTLGDLYVRAGQFEKATAQYCRIAEHFLADGFYPKAAALFKKILKITPDDEAAQMQLAELSARQGLMADAKSYLTSVAAKRRGRGDRRGADEILVKLGTIDPSDIDARIAAARVVARNGDAAAGATRFRELYSDLLEKGREADAMASLREAVRLNPEDREGCATLAKAAVAAGDLETARTYLDRETVGDDPELLVALIDLELRSGNIDGARELLPQLLGLDSGNRDKIIELGWVLAEVNAAAAFVCIDSAVDASIAASDYEDAAAVLQEFVTRLPGQVRALLKLVEVCVDGGLETTMYEAQAQLADAYLAAGQAAEARVIAEDLVAREPWERAHIDRFRRALVMLRVPEPDSVIAERLSGQTPFMATDPFSDAAPMPIPSATDPEPEPEPEPAPVVAPPPVAAKPVVPEAIEVEAEVEELPPPPPVRTPEAPRKKRGPMEIDLSSVLGEMEASLVAPVPVAPPPPAPPQPQNLDDVFQGFRDESGRQDGADQAAQHLTLGKTYLEMGMGEDAIEPLRTAARSPRHCFEASLLLVEIYKQQKDTVHIVEWLERAAEMPAPSEDAGRSLLYDLGTTLESAGETARALAVFLELQADAGDYMDVAARVNRLARVQTGG